MKLYISFFLILFITGCAKDQQVEEKGLRSLLTEAFLQGELQRTSEPRSYIGNSLYEYIDGGAELYHNYGFVEVATADYENDNQELVVDIYKFTDTKGSFGLFSMLMPENPEYIGIGLEGYMSSSSLEFIKGKYIVRIMSYVVSEESKTLMKDIASELEKNIPGNLEYPKMFSFFIENNMIPHSKRLFYKSFLGYDFLTDIYTQDYIIGNDTFRVFLAYDEFDQKYDEWSKNIKMSAKDSIIIAGFNFKHNKGIIIKNSDYGNILVGRVDDFLVGIANYKSGQTEYLKKWLVFLDNINE